MSVAPRDSPPGSNLLKTGHCLIDQYLKWTANQPTPKCWWCPYRTQTGCTSSKTTPTGRPGRSFRGWRLGRRPGWEGPLRDPGPRGCEAARRYWKSSLPGDWSQLRLRKMQSGRRSGISQRRVKGKGSGHGGVGVLEAAFFCFSFVFCEHFSKIGTGLGGGQRGVTTGHGP